MRDNAWVSTTSFCENYPQFPRVNLLHRVRHLFESSHITVYRKIPEIDNGKGTNKDDVLVFVIQHLSKIPAQF